VPPAHNKLFRLGEKDAPFCFGKKPGENDRAVAAQQHWKTDANWLWQLI